MAAVEQLVDNPGLIFGTLGSTITAGATSIAVTGATSAPFPQTGSGTRQYRILIDTEVMIVTGGQGTGTLTVSRGADGSTAAGHTGGVSVIPVITPGAIANLGNMFFVQMGVTGQTGAVTPTMYVGGTNGGPPSTGTFVVGNWVVDIAGQIYICTVAGTPGTWLQAAAPVIRHVEVTMAGNQTIPSGVATLVAYDTVESNDGHWSSVNHNYTVNLAGRYLVTASWMWNATQTTPMALMLYKGGSEYRRLYSAQYQAQQMGGSCVVRLLVNDVIDIRASQFSGGGVANITGSTYNYFQLEYLGA